MKSRIQYEFLPSPTAESESGSGPVVVAYSHTITVDFLFRNHDVSEDNILRMAKTKDSKRRSRIKVMSET